MKKKSLIIFLEISLFVIIGLGLAVYFNHVFIYDFFRGKTYQPSSEMVAIRDSLNLTERGRFLFDASQPALNNEEDFNYNCQSDDEESAILGCYTEKNIYVYNITEERLKGIRELTTAHELLHAVYERMSVGERDAIRADLEKIYLNNLEALKEEIDVYDSEEQLEEIYVRVGTEIKDLTADLEEHFGTIFQDQDAVVDFYNSYIGVFKQLDNELDRLQAEMEDLNTKIDEGTDEYQRRAGQLDADIISFNSCAEVAGCFETEEKFNAKRNQLIAEQNALNALYDEIDGMINRYNELVEQYNNNAIESNNLQNIINSHVRVEGI